MQVVDMKEAAAAAKRRGMKPAVSAGATFDRLREDCGFASDAALAAFLEIEPAAIARLRAEDRLPMDKILYVAAGHGLALDWFLFGRTVRVPDLDALLQARDEARDELRAPISGPSASLHREDDERRFGRADSRLRSRIEPGRVGTIA